jgi:hypothetical protein
MICHAKLVVEWKGKMFKLHRNAALSMARGCRINKFSKTAFMAPKTYNNENHASVAKESPLKAFSQLMFAK